MSMTPLASWALIGLLGILSWELGKLLGGWYRKDKTGEDTHGQEDDC